MEPLRELLGVDHRQALEFFYSGLQEYSDPGVDRDELLYNASVLAHHAQVSTHAAADVPTPSSLSEVFDTFVFDQSQNHEGVMLETAGAQCLLLAGFFEDQMRQRHRIEWYAKLGAGFYQRAAAFERSHRKARLLASLSRHFELWRETQAQLGRSLRDNPYLLSIEENE